MMLPTFFLSSCDAANSWIFGFQDASNPEIIGIIHFHNHLIFSLVFIAILVFWLLYRSLCFFSPALNRKVYQVKYSKNPSLHFYLYFYFFSFNSGLEVIYCGSSYLHDSFVQVLTQEELVDLCEKLNKKFLIIEDLRSQIKTEELQKTPKNIQEIHKIYPGLKKCLSDYFSILDDWRTKSDTVYLHRSFLQIELFLKYLDTLISSSLLFKQESSSTYLKELEATKCLLEGLKGVLNDSNPRLEAILSKSGNPDIYISISNSRGYINKNILVLERLLKN